MNANGIGTKRTLSAAARAEAAAWLARLHGPNRTREVEAGFRRWMAEDQERAAAFELLTDTWERSARLRRRPIERVASWERTGVRLSFSRATLATAAVAFFAVVGTTLYLRSEAVVTGVGEQRTLVLEDGTRIHLNTDSRAVMRYDPRLRRVDLEKGEAMFEVARRPDWPFVVAAGNREIRALGTAFVVRREPELLAVTLVEGKVAVTSVRGDSVHVPTPEHALSEGNSGPSELGAGVDGSRPEHELDRFTLLPGQRLTLASSAPPKLDHPPLDSLTAWQRGQVALDDIVLVDAVAEMNRYSRVRLVIEGTAAAEIRVSGIFRAGDSANFARAVARTYQLQLRERGREILLGEPGTAPSMTPATEP